MSVHTQLRIAAQVNPSQEIQRDHIRAVHVFEAGPCGSQKGHMEVLRAVE